MTSSHADTHNNSSQLLEMTKSLIENFTSENLMTQSLDPTILGGVSLNNSMISSVREPHSSSNNLYNEQSSIPIVQSTGPLITASKMMPVPESLMSPDCGPPVIVQQPQRPVSALTTSSTTFSSVKSARLNQSQRPSSSPATSNKSPRSLKKPEKSSPSSSPSPRKAIANTTNAKIHQNQSILKHSTQTHYNANDASNVSTTFSSLATTEDEEDDSNDQKVKSIRKVAQKSQKQLENNHQQKTFENKEVEKSAILIQKLWRGYSTRKKTVRDIAETLQQKRTQEYIIKLTKDMEVTKQALENERKIQQLHMQAIQQLWKKVSNMQNISENTVIVTGEGVSSSVSGGLGGQDIVQDLTKTCFMLTNQVIYNALKRQLIIYNSFLCLQVQQLQVSMRDILNCMTVFAQLQQGNNSGFKDSSETQTEIIAVHTPQIDQPKDFPFIQKIQRPSSLPINSSSNDSSTSTKSNTAGYAPEESILNMTKECNGGPDSIAADDAGKP